MDFLIYITVIPLYFVDVIQYSTVNDIHGNSDNSVTLDINIGKCIFPMNDFCVKSINGFCYLHLKLIYINGNTIINIYKAKFT